MQIRKMIDGSRPRVPFVGPKPHARPPPSLYGLPSLSPVTCRMQQQPAGSQRRTLAQKEQVTSDSGESHACQILRLENRTSTAAKTTGCCLANPLNFESFRQAGGRGVEDRGSRRAYRRRDDVVGWYWSIYATSAPVLRLRLRLIADQSSA
jgi:hypothetical protein